LSCIAVSLDPAAAVQAVSRRAAACVEAIEMMHVPVS
jgi:hypothetical protein